MAASNLVQLGRLRCFGCSWTPGRYRALRWCRTATSRSRTRRQNVYRTRRCRASRRSWLICGRTGRRSASPSTVSSTCPSTGASCPTPAGCSSRCVGGRSPWSASPACSWPSPGSAFECCLTPTGRSTPPWSRSTVDGWTHQWSFCKTGTMGTLASHTEIGVWVQAPGVLVRIIRTPPPQHPNPSTDNDKTLHNWLHACDKLVTKNWYKSAVRERLVK